MLHSAANSQSGIKRKRGLKYPHTHTKGLCEYLPGSVPAYLVPEADLLRFMYIVHCCVFFSCCQWGSDSKLPFTEVKEKAN